MYHKITLFFFWPHTISISQFSKGLSYAEANEPPMELVIAHGTLSSAVLCSCPLWKFMLLWVKAKCPRFSWSSLSGQLRLSRRLLFSNIKLFLVKMGGRSAHRTRHVAVITGWHWHGLNDACLLMIMAYQSSGTLRGNF